MLGDTLKEQRERLGIDLRDVARALKIRHDYLVAIERSEFEKLPGEVFAKGYIRAYARYLNIDPEPLIEEFNNLYKKEEKNPLSELNPEIVGKNLKKRNRTLQYITGVVIFLILIFIMKIMESNHRETVITKGKEKSSFEKQSEKVEKEKPVITNTRQADIGISSQKENQKTTEQKSFETQQTEYKIRFIASELTWVLVETDNTKKDFILKPGESYEEKMEDRARIVIGNAGGMKVFVNGVERSIDGRSGEVKIINLP